MSLTKRSRVIAFGIGAMIVFFVAPLAAMAGAPLKGIDIKLGKNPAATTAKSGKSNSSDRAVTFGRDKLKGTTKNSGHASE